MSLHPVDDRLVVCVAQHARSSGAVYTSTGTVGVDLAGSLLWEGSPADGHWSVADFNGESLPEVVTVRSNAITIFDGQTGATPSPSSWMTTA